MRPPTQRHAVPVDLDVGMVVLPLGKLADTVDESKRRGKVPELVLSLQSTFNEGVTRGNEHCV